MAGTHRAEKRWPWSRVEQADTAQAKATDPAAGAAAVLDRPGSTVSTPHSRPPRAPRPDEEDERGRFHFLRELPGLILIALILALLIKTFLVQAFFIPSQSMEDTLLVGDRVLVNKVVYQFRTPKRGEIIVFENPSVDEPDRNPLGAFWNWLTEGLGFSSDPNQDFIKRVIGLPGESIEVKNGRVFVNGELLPEPYIHAKDHSNFGPYVVPDGHFFVMGDNRPNSQDSRSALGPIPEEKIVGKAFLRLWPPSRISWLSGG
ncbi:MAG: signal peptidase I [Actinomycetota bacterium]